MAHHLNNFKDRHIEELQSDKLDQKLIELSALFEISQALNSTLNLKSILDTILLVPMGRMMISKGMILFEKDSFEFKIESIKGLPYSLIGKDIHINALPEYPVIINELELDEEWPELFAGYKLELLIPMTSKRKFRGILCFGSKLTQTPYSDDEIEFLSSLANIAVQSIENGLTFDELNQVNRELDHKIQELNTLFEIGKELNRIFDEKDILKQLSYSLMGQMLVNQFFVALKIEGELSIVYKKGSRFDDQRLALCKDFCQSMPDITGPVLIESDDVFYTSLDDLGVKVIVPLDMQGKIGGYIFLGEKLDKSNFTKSNLGFLATLANMAMISLENARLFQETLIKQRLEEELNLARNIQGRLLPEKMPEIKNLDIHGMNIPSRQVGGDYFDILQISEDEFVFTIADVSGKGMPASLLMSNLQAGLQSLFMEQSNLSNITSKLNNLIHKNTSSEKYITFFVMKLNTKTYEFEYVNGGHNPPYIFTPKAEMQTLDEGGLIIGMMPDVKYDTGSGKIEPGACLTMFTDGVTEAMDAENIEFEEAGVIKYFQDKYADISSEELNLQLIETLERYTNGELSKSDDVTIMTIKRLK